MTHKERINQIVEIAFDRLCGKITGKRIVVSSEASLQLQLASILKNIGELFEESPQERFNIELEKNVMLNSGEFVKSKSNKAKIDIWLSMEDSDAQEGHACAIELKYFKKENQREPNNRYDVFKDLHNLESYGQFADCGFLLVATDHSHYINKDEYSEDTKDFDFRNGRSYKSGTELSYRTPKPHGPPIKLKDDYEFKWREVESGLSFLLVSVIPSK